MSVIETILEKAKADPRRIVLAEGSDPRILAAAVQSVEAGTAHPLLLGDADEIAAAAAKSGHRLNDIEVIDPARSRRAVQYAQALFQKRRHKGMTEARAAERIHAPLTYAAMMVAQGDADGMVAGAVHTTAEVVRTVIQLLGVKPGSALVSSFFIMDCRQPHHPLHGSFIFSDSALVIDPDARQLADIAAAAAASAQTLLGDEPRLAMLSFSTHGSAHHPNARKVAEATRLLRDRCPALKVDGEVQVDAALIPEIAASKMRESQVAGQANVLIFPNLDAGNIGYKLVQRLGGGEAIGPLLQGLNHPANDLSRGCDADEVFKAMAVTVVQAQTA